MVLVELLTCPVYGLALATALALWALWLGCRRRRRPGEPPLINGWIPLLGEALNFKKDPYRFLLSLYKKHGDIFTVYIAGRHMTFVMEPLHFPSVIKHGKYLEFKEIADQMSSRAFNHPPILNEKWPDLYENLHRNYQYLSGKPLDTLSDHMMKSLQSIFQKKFSHVVDWETESLNKFCFSIMFEASFATLYGKYPNANGHNITDTIGEKFLKFDAMFSYLVANIPVEFLGMTKRIRKELIDFFNPQNMAKWLGISEVVQERKNLFERYEEFSDYDKAAHHFAFMWAAVGNTIPATFWAMYYLLQHPEALAVVRNEIDHLLQSTGQERKPGYNIHLTREQLDNLVYLESAINESLRICASSMNIRLAKEDLVLKLTENQEVSLRKGDYIVMYPPVLHMHPEVYEDPEKYKFDRYVENGQKKTTFYKQGKKLKYFLMPFGSGSGMCPGRFLAINEIKLCLFLLISYFDMELVEDKHVGLDNSRVGLGILLPDSDIFFRYKLKSK